MTTVKLAGLLLAAALMSGCAQLGYYWQSARGHLELMSAARPVDRWLSDPATPPALRERLALAQRMRDFSVTELKLPDNASYKRYADLGRRAVVWNVVATPEFSLELKTWCFPVAGCVGYRGYFSEADARAQAQALREQGWETGVYGVPAYSTLGWSNWLGGDPLLNTFIAYPEGELARLLFHELAHQVVYAKDDTMFNESFATAVERLGGARWLAAHAGEGARREYAEFDARRVQFRRLVAGTQGELARIYASNRPPGPAGTDRAAMKKIAFERFRADYAVLRERWGGYAGYDAWVATASNPAFAVQAAYDELVPGFEALFEREGRDWTRFYDAVRRLADLPRQERHQRLKEIAGA